LSNDCEAGCSPGTYGVKSLTVVVQNRLIRRCSLSQTDRLLLDAYVIRSFRNT
jgi:hypothetical protein